DFEFFLLSLRSSLQEFACSGTSSAWQVVAAPRRLKSIVKVATRLIIVMVVAGPTGMRLAILM
ncbi:MAG: hypothetical protein O3C40_16555, partial [Planctomycetota bacterium]|nr:hypothetical protein [Planctomycetota bacterium]